MLVNKLLAQIVHSVATVHGTAKDFDVALGIALNVMEIVFYSALHD